MHGQPGVAVQRTYGPHSGVGSIPRLFECFASRRRLVRPSHETVVGGNCVDQTLMKFVNCRHDREIVLSPGLVMLVTPFKKTIHDVP